MSFENLLNAGTSFTEFPREKRSIRLANSIAIGLVFILISLSIVRGNFFSIHRLILPVILGNALLMLIPMLLNHHGYSSASRIALCWLFPILLLGDVWLVLKIEAIRETSTYLGFRIFQVALSGLPLLVFNLKDWKKILLAFSVPVICILFYDPLLEMLNVGYQQSGLSEHTYYYNLVRTIVSVLVVCWSVYSLKKVIEQQDDQNAALILQLSVQNKLIEFQAGKEIEMLNNELVQQLEQVSKAEQKYRMLFEEASDGIILSDVEGNFIDVNPYLCELLGYTREELVRKNYPSILAENELEARLIDYEKIKIGVGITAERTFKSKDGRGITVEKRFKKIDESLFLGISRDIRERKKHEAELEHSKYLLGERLKELKTLYEISRMVNDKNKEKEAVLLDIAAALPKGWQFPEMCCAKVSLYGADYASDGYCESPIHQTSPIWINNQQAGSIKIVYLKKPPTGVDPFMEEEMSLLQSVCGLIQIYLEEQATDEALKRSQANLFSTINNSESLIWSIDKERKLITFNTKLQSVMKEYANIEIKLGERLARSTVQKEILWEGYYADALSGRALSFEKQTFGRNYFYSLNPIIEDDDVIGVSVFGHDVTEITDYRTSLEEKVRERTNELNQALEKEKELALLKTRFASLVSHEFRTPLATIRLTINQIKRYRHRLSLVSIDEKVNIVLEQVDHMTFLLEDVLSLGKAEDPKLQIKRTPINLIEFFDTIKRQIQSVNMKSDHIITCHFRFRNANWVTDPDLLRNIFTNLLTNAIKFAPDDKRIILEGWELNESLKFQVKDHGIGIPEEDLQRIFLPFDRGTNVADIPGTGLGLSIVKKAVELLQGNISVESKVGEGTIFRLSFPCYDEKDSRRR
jgi:PAS domain S-box-containing protein